MPSKSTILFGLTAILLVPSLFAYEILIDYCKDIQCPLFVNRTDHTLCKFHTENPGPECHDIVTKELSDQEKSELVEAHNKVRNLVASGAETVSGDAKLPQAANMGFLAWDNDVAKAAQHWALQCIPEPDKCRSTFPGVTDGQNLALFMDSSKNLSIDKLFHQWYDREKPKFDVAEVDNFKSYREAGRFSQLIWAKTYALGCGAVVHKESDNQYHKLLVCNYGPGHFLREPVYRRGQPCSGCPVGTSCSDKSYPSLCKAPGGKVPYSVLSAARAPHSAGTLSLLAALALTRL